MKKIYVMAAFLGVTTFAFNQANQKVQQRQALKNVAVNVDAPTTNSDKGNIDEDYSSKALGTEYFSSDFSDPSDWSIGGDGDQGAWVIGDVNTPAPSYTQGGNPFIDPLKTTPGDNFAWFDGIQYIIASPPAYGNQNAWIEIANPIDLSGEQTVAFSFVQSYTAYNYDDTYIDMSLDGGATWTSRQLNSNVVTMTTAEQTYFDLRFDVNNSNNVLFRFRMKSDVNTTSDMGYNGSIVWQIDDVVIAGLPDNDLQAVGNYITGDGTDTLVYHQIPLAQVGPISGGGTVENSGTADQTNVKYKAAETVNGVYTAESSPATVAVGQTQTLVLNTPFTPSTKGDYNIDYSVEADDPDDAPANNVFKSYPFTVGDSVYARDNSTDAESGVVHGSLRTDGLSSGNLIVEYALVYEIRNATKLSSMSFQFGNRITEGEQVQVRVLDETGDNLVAEGPFYTMQAGDEGSFHTLKFDPPVDLAPGFYHASLEMFSDTASLATATYASAQKETASFRTSAGWGYLGPVNPVYVLRMNLNETAGVEDNALNTLNITQYPNPFANETTVRFSLDKASNVSYTITDMTGKVVATVNEGNLMTGNHTITVDGSSFANGIYYFNLKTDNAQVTRKMVVNK